MLVQTLFAAVLMSGPASVDVRVDGDGFLRFASEYKISYAKSAKLVVADGKLVHVTGARVMPTISVPNDAVSLAVDLEGNVVATSRRGQSACGRFVLAIFPANAPLNQNGVFLTSPERPALGNPGEGTNGVIRVDKAPVSDAKGTRVTPPATEKTGTAKAPTKNNQPAEKASTSAAVTIVVAPKSWVTGSKILLGEVAKIEGEEATVQRLSTVSLGETPTFNLKRILTRQSVITRLLAAKEKPETLTIVVPENAEVWRKGQAVSGELISDAAQAYAKQQLGLEAELTIKEAVSETQVPTGKLEIVPVAVSDSIPNVIVTVTLRVDGKNVSTKTVKLHANTAEGVKAGDTIKIRIRSNGAVVELTGKARYNAVVGQTVTVITSRNTSHTGKVVAPGVVEVSL